MNKTMWSVMIVALFALTALSSGCINTGSGHHVGYVSAVETEGTIWPTGKVYFKTDSQSSQEDTYCVDALAPNYEELMGQLRAAANNRTRVEISYHSEAFTSPRRCGGSNTIVDSVRPA